MLALLLAGMTFFAAMLALGLNADAAGLTMAVWWLWAWWEAC